ncbi:MAG TPA: universal stress protein [Stellaceae bacterium]|nr:universal stress protein [Stellaceae bacterium]
MKCILAAVDGSAGSMRAVEFAATLAAKFQTELVLVAVAGPEKLPDFALMDVQRDQVRSGAGAIEGIAEGLARDALNKARKQALACGAGSVRAELRFGDAADEVLGFQKQTGADLIVVGSRGRGRLAGLLLGSVSQKIANAAPCSVAIAR